jgi:ATP-dependent Clp protease ATP-binding subunit ClpC
MFERFTEEARRSLFFSRAKTVERLGDAISVEDLLDGIALGGPKAIELLGDTASAFRSAESGEQFSARTELNRNTTWEEHARKEIPFSEATKRVLQFATSEADFLLHQAIGPEHLLLGVMREEGTEASRRLREAGVRLGELRSVVKATHRERGFAD